MTELIRDPAQLIKLDEPKTIWDHIKLSDKIQYFWLGRQPYYLIWGLQKQLHSRRVIGEISDVVLLLEHDHVYTFGKNADRNHLLDSKPNNTEVIQIDRGGEVTYHGPGQLVCYPILDLHNYEMSVSWYMRSLEDVIIRYLYEHSINSNQKPGLTGVWVGDNKICALGVRLSRWVTMHGFALNIQPDMHYFEGIIPCGIFEYGVTSLYELGIEIDVEILAEKIIGYFDDIFTEIKK